MENGTEALNPGGQDTEYINMMSTFVQRVESFQTLENLFKTFLSDTNEEIDNAVEMLASIEGSDAGVEKESEKLRANILKLNKEKSGFENKLKDLRNGMTGLSAMIDSVSKLDLKNLTPLNKAQISGAYNLTEKLKSVYWSGMNDVKSYSQNLEAYNIRGMAGTIKNKVEESKNVPFSDMPEQESSTDRRPSGFSFSEFYKEFENATTGGSEYSTEVQGLIDDLINDKTYESDAFLRLSQIINNISKDNIEAYDLLMDTLQALEEVSDVKEERRLAEKATRKANMEAYGKREGQAPMSDKDKAAMITNLTKGAKMAAQGNMAGAAETTGSELAIGAMGGRAALTATQVATAGAVVTALVGTLALLTKATIDARKGTYEYSIALKQLGKDLNDNQESSIQTSNSMNKLKNRMENFAQDFGDLFSGVMDFLVQQADALLAKTGLSAEETKKKVYGTQAGIAMSARQSGFTTDSANYLALDTYRSASKLAQEYGQQATEVAEKLGDAWLSGSDSAKEYGIVLNDDVLTGWLAVEKGIDIANVEISEARKQLYRFELMSEQVNASDKKMMANSIKGWMETGKQIDATKQKLFGFDEVIQLSAMDVSIPSAPEVLGGTQNLTLDDVDPEFFDKFKEYNEQYEGFFDTLEQVESEFPGFLGEYQRLQETYPGWSKDLQEALQKDPAFVSDFQDMMQNNNAFLTDFSTMNPSFINSLIDALNSDPDFVNKFISMYSQDPNFISHLDTLAASDPVFVNTLKNIMDTQPGFVTQMQNLISSNPAFLTQLQNYWSTNPEFISALATTLDNPGFIELLRNELAKDPEFLLKFESIFNSTPGWLVQLDALYAEDPSFVSMLSYFMTNDPSWLSKLLSATSGGTEGTGGGHRSSEGEGKRAGFFETVGSNAGKAVGTVIGAPMGMVPSMAIGSGLSKAGGFIGSKVDAFVSGVSNFFTGGKNRKRGFADGGIGTKEINNATLFEGNKKEAVIPLETQAGVDYLAKAMQQAGSQTQAGGGGDVIVNLSLNGVNIAENDAVWNEVANKIGERLEVLKQQRGELSYGSTI